MSFDLFSFNRIHLTDGYIFYVWETMQVSCNEITPFRSNAAKTADLKYRISPTARDFTENFRLLDFAIMSGSHALLSAKCRRLHQSRVNIDDNWFANWYHISLSLAFEYPGTHRFANTAANNVGKLPISRLIEFDRIFAWHSIILDVEDYFSIDCYGYIIDFCVMNCAKI